MEERLEDDAAVAPRGADDARARARAPPPARRWSGCRRPRARRGGGDGSRRTRRAGGRGRSRPARSRRRSRSVPSSASSTPRRPRPPPAPRARAAAAPAVKPHPPRSARPAGRSGRGARPEPLLERLDLEAHGGLRDPQPLGGEREAASLDHDAERRQLRVSIRRAYTVAEAPAGFPNGSWTKEPVDAPRSSRRPRAIAGRVQARADRVEVVGDEPGVGLAGGRERLLDADVELLGPGAEPARRRARGSLRLRQLLHPEQPAVEGPRRPLRSRGGAAIWTWSMPVTVIAEGLPSLRGARRLEDTLVAGYPRLAAETPRRRIDIELRALDLVFATLFGLLLLPVAAVIALAVLVDERPAGALPGRARRPRRPLLHDAEVPDADARRRVAARAVPRRGARTAHRGRVHAHRPLAEGVAARRDPAALERAPRRHVVRRPAPDPRRASSRSSPRDLPAYWQRLVVRPGLTGFAQVRRGYETSMAEKLAHDLEWIADRSVRAVPAHAVLDRPSGSLRQVLRAAATPERANVARSPGSAPGSARAPPSPGSGPAMTTSATGRGGQHTLAEPSVGIIHPPPATISSADAGGASVLLHSA